MPHERPMKQREGWKKMYLLAGVEGLEPPTPGFGDRCSSQLSYTPISVTSYQSSDKKGEESLITDY